MDLDADLRTTEFLAVDVETNGRMGDDCELTEVGAVLVGGGELHDRYVSLVAVRSPLSAGIQRFTGITQAMVAAAPEPATVLARVAELLDGRVLVAHNASFDRRALRQAFEREGLDWPDPPVLCTVALARRFAPLAGQRRLAALAAALGIDVHESHRALPDAETCARVFCALFPRLCANAPRLGDALALVSPRRAARRRDGHPPARVPVEERPDLSTLPDDPGVYVFRDERGRALYVGKSVSVRARARAHFTAPGDWTGNAELVEHRPTNSELGALVLENRLIKALQPPGNRALKRVDGHVFLTCRLDIAYPILEVATRPPPGHAVTVGPLRGRTAAAELVEQLNSIFGLRHCGRRLRLRQHPSAYGQMGRCLSPCLGDLDPNAYRRRLDSALELFTGSEDGGALLLEHIAGQMRAAAAEQRYERAAWLRRRHDRLEILLDRLGGMLRAVHARSRLALAAHPSKPHADAFWIVGGRVADWGPLPDGAELAERTRAALAQSPLPGPGALVPAEEVDEVRLVAGWLARHPDTPALDLDPTPGQAALARFVEATGLRPGEPAASRRPSRSRSRARRGAGRGRERLPR